MIYAIVRNGTVNNLIELNPEQESEFPGCVSCEEVPAHIGDTWDGENFYRDGERVKTYAEIAEEADDPSGDVPPEIDPDEPTMADYAEAGRILLGVSE